MHGRTSARSLYLRYFSVVKQVSDKQVALFTEVDNSTRAGLVAELGGADHRGRHLPPELPRATPTPPRSPSSWRTPSSAADSARSCSSTSPPRRRSAGSAGSPPRCSAENSQMVRVFIDAGYVGATGSTTPGSSTWSSTSRRPRNRVPSRCPGSTGPRRGRSPGCSSPRSIAVIGASDEPTKLGHAVLLNLLRGNFSGPGVSGEPGRACRCRACGPTRSVTDIPDPVDLAVVTVPAATVAEVVEACRAKGVHGLVVMTAGFADASTSGRTSPEPAASAAGARRPAAHGRRWPGPPGCGCSGRTAWAWSTPIPAIRMNATLAPVVPPPGRIGFFCQSGALGIAILADAAARGLGLSTFVSAGNRADVSGNDLLQFWHGDDRTEVVLLYLESFGNPRKFARLARVLARTKPVIAVKSGRHARSTPGLAASSAPLSEAAVATLFEQSGVIRTPGLTAAFDVAQLLVHPTGAGRATGSASSATPARSGVLAVDFCLDAGCGRRRRAARPRRRASAPTELAAAVRAAVAPRRTSTRWSWPGCRRSRSRGARARRGAAGGGGRVPDAGGRPPSSRWTG